MGLLLSERATNCATCPYLGEHWKVTLKYEPIFHIKQIAPRSALDMITVVTITVNMP
ncbi:hypothetical protein FRC09_019920, partial [Ceratobasidium sp. 395]